jgi:hypothetical protein
MRGHLVRLLVLAGVAHALSSSSSSNTNATGVDVNLLFSTPEGQRGLDDMELAPLTAACVACVVGVVVCLVGARVLRHVALGCAFFDGAFGTAATLANVLENAEWEGVVSWSCFFLGGIFCCLLVMSTRHGDVVCVGITAGLLTAFTSLTTFGYRLAPDHPDFVLYGLLVVCGLGSGLLTLKTQPGSVILATSWIGSNMATWGMGYFLGDYPNATTMAKFRHTNDGHYELPKAWWGYLAGAMALFLLGTCVQAQFKSRSSRWGRPRETVANECTSPSDHYTSVQTPTSLSPLPSPLRTSTRRVHFIV